MTRDEEYHVEDVDYNNHHHNNNKEMRGSAGTVLRRRSWRWQYSGLARAQSGELLKNKVEEDML